ncbi:Kinase, NEK [Giardia muris]|uniref:non-specific serine/threonine protein kinase n=1 Tax=Giardia muris TaxID=5742 RepID=A0A4Z1T2W2_GIAMU|nr:Kinase, NEK [Giardia muris]|eukprot:TNJ28283.1 Kinase, NEK [Giardia muris]
MNGTTLGGRYELAEQIGVGAYGRVFLCHDIATNMRLACKRVDYGSIASDIQQRIEQEYQLVRSLEHPHIIKYHDYIVDREHQALYLISDYFSRKDLESYCALRHERGAALDEEDVWLILAQLVDVLAYCHSPAKPLHPDIGPVLHRNIRPENILLRDDGGIILTGFRAAKPLGEHNNSSTRIGRAAYMSPEMLAGRAYDDKTDIWSLGCTIYEACTNRALFHGSNAADVSQEHRLFTTPIRIPGYSEELSNVVSAMLEIDSVRRPSALQLFQHPHIERVWSLHRQGFGEQVHQPGSPDFVPCQRCSGISPHCEVCNGRGVLPRNAEDLDASLRRLPDQRLEAAASFYESTNTCTKARRTGRSRRRGLPIPTEPSIDDPGLNTSRRGHSRSSSRSQSRSRGYGGCSRNSALSSIARQESLAGTSNGTELIYEDNARNFSSYPGITSQLADGKLVQDLPYQGSVDPNQGLHRGTPEVFEALPPHDHRQSESQLNGGSLTADLSMSRISTSQQPYDDSMNADDFGRNGASTCMRAGLHAGGMERIRSPIDLAYAGRDGNRPPMYGQHVPGLLSPLDNIGAIPSDPLRVTGSGVRCMSSVSAKPFPTGHGVVAPYLVPAEFSGVPNGGTGVSGFHAPGMQRPQSGMLCSAQFLPVEPPQASGFGYGPSHGR